MKRRLISSLFAVIFFISNPVFSQFEESTQTEPVIVTATRTPELEESIGKTVSVIRGETLETAKDQTILESLRQIPGLRVQQLGGPGNFSSIRIRGLDTSDTQLLINGLPFRDAAEPQGSASGFFQDFMSDFLKQIEVVRGSSATLYGSDSVGGTLNLIPIRPEGKPTLQASFEGGTLNTYKQTYSVKGGNPNLGYLLGYSRLTSDGIDSHDDYDNNTYTVFLNSSPVENVEIEFNFIGSDTRLDLNEAATLINGELVTAIDDPNDFRDSEFFFYGTHVRYQATESWEHILRFGAVDSNREFVIRTDPDGSDFPSESEFNGNTYNIEYQTNLQVNETHLVTFGYEHEREELEQITQDLGVEVKEEPEQYKNDYYLQDQMNFLDETLFVTGGIRITDHETVGTDVNGEGSVAYLIPEWGTKLRGHVGTGFRAPSLFELFGASTFGGTRFVFGNEDLNAEESISWDVGVDQKLLNDKVEMSVTFFRQDFDEVIGFENSSFVNVDDSETLGIESEVVVHWAENLLTRFFYTFTDSEDTNGDKVLGIPEHLWGVDLVCRFLEKFTLFVRGTYKGEDNFNVFVAIPTFSVVRVTSDDYFKVDAVLSCQVNENTEVYVRAENIFDEEIIENGFEGIPVLIFGGIKIKI